MTPAQAKRQAAIHEAMAILWRQMAALDREIGNEACAILSEESASDHENWQQDAERIACSTQ